MRVLMLSAEYPPTLSGMGDYGKKLACALKECGSEVFVLTSKINEPTNNDTRDVRVFRTMQSWNAASFSTICKTIEETRPDIIHLQYMMTTFGKSSFMNFLTSKLKRIFPKIKIVTTFHEFAAPWKRLALLPLFWGSDAYVVTNDRHYEILQKISSLLRSKALAMRIPLGANITPELSDTGKKKEYRKMLAVEDSEILFVRFGIVHDISLPEILKTMGILKKLLGKGHKLRLLLVGKAEARARQALERSIQEMGCGDWVCLRFDQSEENISKCLYASDIGIAVYPDGISEKRTAYLALAGHGVPVIATKRGVLSHEFLEGENILCIPAQYDDSVWMAVFEKMLKDNPLRTKISAGGRQLYQQHQWPNIARQTAELYEAVLK